MKSFLIFAGIFALQPGIQAQAQETEAPVPLEAIAATRAAEAGGLGPFPATMESDATLPGFTIYRPKDMAGATRNGPLPVVVWGNGACVNIGNRFRYFLTEVASHGYVVIAIGKIADQKFEYVVDSREALKGQEGEFGAFNSTPAQLIEAMDWAISATKSRGSGYFGMLDATKLAAMGQSCGGLQAIDASRDPRVKTTLVLNSGTFPIGSPTAPETGSAAKEMLSQMRAPAIWINGDKSDMAHDNGHDDFEAIDQIPIVWAWHDGTAHAPHYRKVHGGEFVGPVVNWLDWQLKGRKASASAFMGEDCDLCGHGGWHLEAKGF